VKERSVVEKELAEYSQALAVQPRWLVLNKIDLLPADERASVIEQLVQQLDWDGPVFAVSAATGEGVDALIHAVMNYFDGRGEDAA